MTFPIATAPSILPGRRELATRAKLRASNMRDVHAVENLLWQQSGSRWGGRHWDGGRVFSGASDLADWVPCSKSDRKVSSNRSDIKLTLQAQLDGGNIFVDIINAATGVTLGQFDVDGFGEINESTLTIAYGDTLDGSGDPALLYGDVTFVTSGLELWYVTLFETDTLTATDIPVGLP